MSVGAGATGPGLVSGVGAKRNALLVLAAGRPGAGPGAEAGTGEENRGTRRGTRPGRRGEENRYGKDTSENDLIVSNCFPSQQIAMPGGSSAVEGQEMTEKDFEGKSPEEIEMMKVMGFGNFDTTKGKKVRGNDVGDVHVVLKRKYRQYMNRKGGFNRPLDFVH